MKKFYSKNAAVIIIILILFACKKTDPPPVTVVTVAASVAGRVTDLNNAPISDASVAAGAENSYVVADVFVLRIY
jgi:hypothetical protein